MLPLTSLASRMHKNCSPAAAPTMPAPNPMSRCKNSGKADKALPVTR